MSSEDDDRSEKEDHDDDDYESDEEYEKPKKAVNNNEKNVDAIVYTTDGLSHDDYKKFNRLGNYNKELVRSECCHNYYKPDGYIHQTATYGLGIQGINTCIHCYISLNVHKFADCKNLTSKEEACLKYYIDNYSEDHDSSKCTRCRQGGRCLLCESRLGKKPKICQPETTVECIETIIDGSTDKPSLVMSDVLMVDKRDVNYVLTL